MFIQPEFAVAYLGALPLSPGRATLNSAYVCFAKNGRGKYGALPHNSLMKVLDKLNIAMSKPTFSINLRLCIHLILTQP